MPNKPVEIALASDANYYHGLALALASVLKNTSHLDDAGIHILDGGLHPWQKNVLRQKVSEKNSGIHLVFHPLNPEKFIGLKLMKGSALPYARLLLPELLPDLQEIIYLDVDVYYGMDLWALWTVDVSRHAVAAVRDSTIRRLVDDCPWIQEGSPNAEKHYFNSGVLKINLLYWRMHDVGNSSIALSQSDTMKVHPYFDQTVLNYLLFDAVHWLPEAFNTAEPLIASRAVDVGEMASRNIHYITKRKPWLQYSSRTAFKHWRRQYAALVSRWPRYMASYRYWTRFEWRELIIGSVWHLRICRFLLATSAYRFIPGLTETLVRDQLRIAQKKHGGQRQDSGPSS